MCFVDRPDPIYDSTLNNRPQSKLVCLWFFIPTMWDGPDPVNVSVVFLKYFNQCCGSAPILADPGSESRIFENKYGFKESSSGSRSSKICTDP